MQDPQHRGTEETEELGELNANRIIVPSCFPPTGLVFKRLKKSKMRWRTEEEFGTAFETLIFLCFLLSSVLKVFGVCLNLRTI
jgi:hypothetical protein